MLLAIAADLHDNLANLKIFLDLAAAGHFEKIIFAGDLTNDETLEYLAANFTGEIFLVGGNADNFEKSDIAACPQITYQSASLNLQIEGLKILVVHKPEDLEKILSTQTIKPDFAFYGHTHKPWLENRDKMILANPGTLGGVYYQATFALLDTATKHLELKRLF
jgi:putative phosphoesterase